MDFEEEEPWATHTETESVAVSVPKHPLSSGREVRGVSPLVLLDQMENDKGIGAYEQDWTLYVYGSTDRQVCVADYQSGVENGRNDVHLKLFNDHGYTDAHYRTLPGTTIIHTPNDPFHSITVITCTSDEEDNTIDLLLNAIYTILRKVWRTRKASYVLRETWRF